MLSITGLLAIPQEPKVNIVKPESSSGFFINFQGVSPGKSNNGQTEYHYWNCMVWVPEDELEKWEKTYLIPGSILFLEHATAISIPTQDGKYFNFKVKLDHHKTKKLVKPVWI